MPLAVLSPYVRREDPSWEVDCYSEHIPMQRLLGKKLYYKIAEDCYRLGELMYAPLLHPENREKSLRFCVESLQETSDARQFALPGMYYGRREVTWELTIDLAAGIIERRMDEFVDKLAEGRYDLIGLSTTFGQLFGNLALAKRIKERLPDTKVLLGGSTVSKQCGPSVLKNYPFVDYVIQGEGEVPLTALARWLRTGEGKIDDTKGILTRSNYERFPDGVALSEVARMDDLPMPEFHDMEAVFQETEMWTLTLESSRGCWWDRVKASGNVKKTCHFCNLNVQWNGYREKSIARVLAEVKEQTARYGVGRVMFVDNIIRLKGVTELAQGLKDLKIDLSFFYEMRASISPYELVKLWEAGLNRCQVGIEGLSNAYLRRIGKGTTVIQNLQVMKTCHELGLSNESNLLWDFPGSTQEEVNEMRDVIMYYAYHFPPLAASKFTLGIGSTVDYLKSEYPIKNVRTVDAYKHALPKEVYENARFFDLDFDWDGAQVDWQPFLEAMGWWSGTYEQRKEQTLLCYVDSGSSLRIHFPLTNRDKTILLRDFERDLYRYCLQIRRLEDIEQRFRGRASPDEIQAVLDSWCERLIMFKDGPRYLGLAAATHANKAARRIIELHEEDLAYKAELAPVAPQMSVAAQVQARGTERVASIQ